METYLGVKMIQAEPSKIKPEGMDVVYEDGYKSWSPQSAFDNAYRRINNLTFGLAIEAAKKGEKIARHGWNGVGIFVKLQRPRIDSKMTHPYLYMDTTGLQTNNPNAPKVIIPWLASQTDMLAEDWFILGVVDQRGKPVMMD